MVRQQVISLYRDVFRALRAMPDDAQKKEVKAWAKEEFRRNQHHTDEVTIAQVVGSVDLPFCCPCWRYTTLLAKPTSKCSAC